MAVLEPHLIYIKEEGIKIEIMKDKIMKRAMILGATALAVGFVFAATKTDAYAAESGTMTGGSSDVVYVESYGPGEDMVSLNATADDSVITFKASDNKYSGAASGKTVTDTRYGIDVSHHQGEINWDQVKAERMQFAFVRVGYRSEGPEGNLGEDKCFRRNLAEANRVGIPVGVYIYSQAITQEEAREEARFVMDRIKPYQISLPVVIDYESTNGAEVKGRLQVYYNMGVVNKEIGTGICWAFCDEVQKSGIYTPMIYANKNWFTNYIDGPALAQQFRIWVAQYSSENTYNGPYDFWQYSSKGQVLGISGNVDCNVWYVKDGIDNFTYTGIIDQVGNGNVDDLRYAVNGAISNTFTGVGSYYLGMYYFKDGVVDKTFNGMAMASDGGWYYFTNGVRDASYTGMACNEYGWWYFENGSLNLNYTGIGINEYGTWYYRNGTIDWSTIGMVNVVGQWKYVKDGKITNYTGIAANQWGWWYMRDGDIDFGYTGMACNEYGWWFIRNGQLDWNYTGAASNEYGVWYFVDGTINWSCNGMLNLYNKWWYVENGRFILDYTGMASNQWGWWYYQNGNLDFGYTGMACNEYGWWYFRNGQLDWNYTGASSNEYGVWYFVNGNIAWNYTGMLYIYNDWWYVNGGQFLMDYTGMACNEYGWWYYQNGHINFGYTGMACNEYGWWYYQNGQINFGYTGMACNEYGWWYYRNGQLDWNYTGLGVNEYGTWYYQNGNIDFNFNGTVDIDGKTYNIAGGRVL